MTEKDRLKLWKVWLNCNCNKYFGGAVCAGYIEKSEQKRVVIQPKKNLDYLGKTLGVR